MLTQSVRTGKGNMGYIKFGSGERAFVILPGLSVHSILNYADAVAAAYAEYGKRYTVYLFDRPEDIAIGCSVYDIACATASAFGELGISSCDIFGASLGGMIALSLLLDYPLLCSNVILGSTLSRPNPTFLSVSNEWIRKAERRDEEGLLSSFINNVYSEKTAKEYGKAIFDANKGITEKEYERFIILARSSLSFDVSERLGEIKSPVLVLGSEGDRVVTPEASLEIIQALGCEGYIYPSSYGHAVYDEAPDYRRRMLDFLNKTEK